MKNEIIPNTIDRSKWIDLLSQNFAISNSENLLFLIEALQLVNDFQSNIKKYFENYELTQSQFVVLVCLYCESKHQWSPAELAQKVHLTRASMTSLLDKLETSKWIKRTHNKTDRRQINIELSQNGQKNIETVLKKHFTSINEILGAYSSNNKTKLTAQLKELAAISHKLTQL